MLSPTLRCVCPAYGWCKESSMMKLFLFVAEGGAIFDSDLFTVYKRFFSKSDVQASLQQIHNHTIPCIKFSLSIWTFLPTPFEFGFAKSCIRTHRHSCNFHVFIFLAMCQISHIAILDSFCFHQRGKPHFQFQLEVYRRSMISLSLALAVQAVLVRPVWPKRVLRFYSSRQEVKHIDHLWLKQPEKPFDVGNRRLIGDSAPLHKNICCQKVGWLIWREGKPQVVPVLSITICGCMVLQKILIAGLNNMAAKVGVMRKFYPISNPLRKWQGPLETLEEKLVQWLWQSFSLHFQR